MGTSVLAHGGNYCTAAAVPTTAISPPRPRPTLSTLIPQEFKPLKLTRVDQLTHNTKRFVFALPHPEMRLGLPTGQHITFLATGEDGKDVFRRVCSAGAPAGCTQGLKRDKQGTMASPSDIC